MYISVAIFCTSLITENCTLSISGYIYPIAYNKWIKYQFVNILHNLDLYNQLPSILSIRNFESDEINEKATKLYGLLNYVK